MSPVQTSKGQYFLQKAAVIAVVDLADWFYYSLMVNNMPSYNQKSYFSPSGFLFF